MRISRVVMPLMAFILVGSAQAQPDVTRDDVFVAGDVFEFFGVNADNAEPGPAGNGVTWDFNGLTRLSADDFVTTYDNASVAPNADQFPNANLVAIQDAGPVNAYTFFDVNDQRFILEGLDLPDIGVVTYDNKQIWLEYPLSFNETQMDDFDGQYVVTVQGFTVTAERTGDFSTTYDGFGTLILPDGTTVNDVRRFKYEQTITDVVSVSGVQVTTEVETLTYSYWPVGERAPVFQLTFGDTTINPPGTTVQSVVASYRGVDGGGEPPVASNKRIPHLTVPGGNFSTDVMIYNRGDSSESVTLQPYDLSGAVLGDTELNIGAGQIMRADQTTYFSNPSTASLSIDGCDSCTTTVGYRAAVANASTAHVHQTGRFSDEFYFYPGEWDVLFDGAAIVNVGTEAASIDAVQIGNNGQELGRVNLVSSLAPDSKFLDVFNSYFNDPSDSIIKLESTQPMAVMILRISTDGRYLYENLPLPDGPGSERWVAHITSDDGGFDTDVYVHNSAGTAQSVTFQPYSSEGSAMSTVQVDVPANSTERFAKLDLFQSATSHASISGSSDVTVTVGYRARVDNASTAPIHEAAPVGTSFTIYPGEWDVLFDGLALVNTGDASANVTATLVADNGNVLQTVNLVQNLPPNGKFLNVLEGLLQEEFNATIRVESTQPLAILSLRLSKDARFLYGNNPLPQ